TREQEFAVGGERDRGAPEGAQRDVGCSVENAAGLRDDVLQRHDGHAAFSTAPAKTFAASTIPSSAGTSESSCSIAAVSTSRAASASRNVRHHDASWPRPTAAKRQGAASGQRWSSTPFNASLCSSKTTSLRCAYPTRCSR